MYVYCYNPNLLFPIVLARSQFCFFNEEVLLGDSLVYLENYIHVSVVTNYRKIFRQLTIISVNDSLLYFN